MRNITLEPTGGWQGGVGWKSSSTNVSEGQMADFFTAKTNHKTRACVSNMM